MHFWTFVFSLMGSAILTAVIRQVALFLNTTPKNDYRRQQKGAIALWGGLAIYLTLVATYFVEPSVDLRNIIIAGSLLAITGVIDDRFELQAGAKFGAQFLAAFVWLHLNGGQSFLLDAGMTPFIGLFISSMWIVGLCNAFNLIDGADGQCSLAALVGFAVLGTSFLELVPVSVPLIGATLGFLFWNFPPAKIYLGESGSTLLGFCLATLTLSLPVQYSAVPPILGSLFIVAFPLTDTVLAIGRRIIKKRPIFSGDKDHIHHLLQKLGFNKFQSLMIVSFMMVSAGLTAFNLFRMNKYAGFVLTLNSASLMTFILYGLYHTKNVAAQKVSYFGKSLLEKHMYRLNLDPINHQCQKGYLIDLLPYYAELQSSGIANIISFVKEVSSHFSGERGIHLYSVGSYSIAVLYDDGVSWTEGECDGVSQKLKKTFLNFGVLKSLSPTPEGVSFYDKKDIRLLLDMIDATAETASGVVTQKAG